MLILIPTGGYPFVYRYEQGGIPSHSYTRRGICLLMWKLHRVVGNNEVIFYHPPIIVNKDELRCFLDLELTISMERTNMDKHD